MTRNADRARREAIEQYGPAPTTPAEALAHVVAVWAGEPDDRMMVDATSNVYGPGIRTGLTLGDLRAIQALRHRYEAALGHIMLELDSIEAAAVDMPTGVIVERLRAALDTARPA